MKNCSLRYQGIDVATWIKNHWVCEICTCALNSGNLNAVRRFAHLLYTGTSVIGPVSS
jgi:hypothetical protein